MNRLKLGQKTRIRKKSQSRLQKLAMPQKHNMTAN